MNFNTFSRVNQQIINALLSLPERTLISDSNMSSGFAEIELTKIVENDIQDLNNLENFLNVYGDYKIMVLAGMVNTGKSAIGNFLLNRAESEIFQENCIRETSEAREARLDEETLIFDLPGLGSVLSEEDDVIVKSIINRASLILLVLDINYPIPQCLYDFLKSDDVIKNGDYQRIIIIINKIDCLSDLPEKLQNQEIQRYTKFLIHGNENMGFQGIANLFNYEIPIVPFSVKKARKDSFSQREIVLRRTINHSLKLTTNTSLIRAEYDLQKIARKYVNIFSSYVEIVKKLKELDTQITVIISTVKEQIAQSFNTEASNFWQRCISIGKSCISEMDQYTPDSAERFWQGDNFKRKKERSAKCRDRYREQIVNEFNSFTSNLRSNVSIITRNLFGSIYVSAADTGHITDALKNSIYEIWDAYDDYWFRDLERYTFDRSITQSNEYMKTAAARTDEWISNFYEAAIAEMIDKKERLSLYSEFSKYLSHADNLVPFFEEFTKIDYIKEFLQNN